MPASLELLPPLVEAAFERHQEAAAACEAVALSGPVLAHHLPACAPGPAAPDPVLALWAQQ
jgi:hypothetical protein